MPPQPDALMDVSTTAGVFVGSVPCDPWLMNIGFVRQVARVEQLVGVAQPIVREGGIGRGGQVFQRRARPPDIVVGEPVGDLGGASSRSKNRVSLSRSSRIRPFKTLDEAVLHRLSRRDQVPVDARILF